MIDVGLVEGQVRLLVLSSLAILLIGGTRSGLLYIQRYLGEWIATHVGYDFRNRLYDHIQNLSFSFHDHAQTGQLISRCIEDVRSIERFTGFGVVEIIRLGLLMIGIVTFLFVKQPNLAWIALGNRTEAVTRDISSAQRERCFRPFPRSCGRTCETAI